MLGEEKINQLLSAKKTAKDQLGLLEYKPGQEKIVKKNLQLNFFSFSQLYTFLDCQLRYKLKYILKISESPTASASFGSTIHISLENFYREWLQNKKIGLSRLLEIYRSSWIPVGYTSKAYQTRMKLEGKKMLTNYWQKLHHPQIKILDLEKFFKIKIDDIIISGKIDRVDQQDKHKIEIIDYKTGKKVTEKNKQKDLQLAIYLLAAIDPQLYAKKPEDVILSFYWLQSGEKVSNKKDSSEIGEIKDSIRKIVNDIRATDWTSFHLKACNKCSYCFIFNDNPI
jgi:DNA helicase-2/ATP-dependent DNA helicase PcrA